MQWSTDGSLAGDITCVFYHWAPPPKDLEREGVADRAVSLRPRL